MISTSLTYIMYVESHMTFYYQSYLIICFFFSSRRRHTRYWRDWSSDVCSSDLPRTRSGVCGERPADQVSWSCQDCLSGLEVRGVEPAAEHVGGQLVEVGIGGEIGRASCRERV